ncbi:MAG: hypothetical protein QM831_00230 [Kofleriaceae bacterium]
MSWLGKLFGKRPDDKVENVVDTTIPAHLGVANHFDDDDDDEPEEDESSITFQLYAIDPNGQTRAEMQGPRLAELSIPGSAVSGSDTVAAVKQRLLARILGAHAPGTHVTFVISGREMTDDKLFYADHYILLPCWIQVVSSDVPFTDVLATMKTLPA